MLDLQKFIQNTLKGKFNSKIISWAGDLHKDDSVEMVINTISKDQATNEINNIFEKFTMENEELQKDSQEFSNMRTANHIKDKTEMYSPSKASSRKIIDPTKSCFDSNNPDLVLLFNTSEFRLGHFPPLMREFCEILHCGQLHKLNILKFYDVMSKFIDIEKRWGI